MFAGGDELLGEQVAAAAGALDRPGPLFERRRPRQQPLELCRVGAHLDLAELALVAVDRDGGVGRLVRVDADDHVHDLSPDLTMNGRPWWALLIPDRSRVRTSFEPHHGEVRRVDTSLESHSTSRAGASRARPARASDATNKPQRLAHQTIVPGHRISPAPNVLSVRRFSRSYRRFTSAPRPAISDRIDGSILCGVHTKPERAVTALLLGYEDVERARHSSWRPSGLKRNGKCGMTPAL